MDSMNHELISLRPLGTPSKRDIAWNALLVEYGIDFAFDESHDLPSELPGDLTGVKAVTCSTDDLATHLAGPLGPKLRAFADAGGVLLGYWGPEDQSPIDENSTRGALDMVCASANLTCNHPRLRQRMQAQTFGPLYDRLIDPYFIGQIETTMARGLDRVYDEPFSYNILHTMEAFAEYDPGRGWHARLRDVLDRITAMPDPEMNNIDRTTGLSVFVRMSIATGESRYRDLAARLTRKVVDTFPRIAGVTVLQPMRDRNLWTECLANLPPVCVAVGDDDMVALAVHTAHTLHELNYDPKKKLWYHWSRPTPGGNQRGPAIWARGQGWALTGLVGILRHLDAQHPDRPALIGYLNEIIEGLIATQNDEGLWHNVMDMPDISRVAGRASGMFIYCLAEARRAGWIDDRADAMLHKAWRALRGRVWQDKLCTNCCGTGAGATLQHYLSRPMLYYGASTVLRAGVNYCLAFGDDEP